MRAARSRADAVIFAHPLAITPGRATAIQHRSVDAVRPDASPPFAIAPRPDDWDMLAALNAPGQSGSPDSAHFSDFARRWAAGAQVQLAFTDAAVQAATASTLTLTVRTTR